MIFDLFRLGKITKVSFERNELKLVKCPNVGSEKDFSHRMENKKDLEGNKCLCIPLYKKSYLELLKKMVSIFANYAKLRH